MDILMPDKDGIECIMDLRREFPQAKLIAMSGGAQTDGLDLLDIAKMLGAHKALRKPIDVQDLVGAIEAVLES